MRRFYNASAAGCRRALPLASMAGMRRANALAVLESSRPLFEIVLRVTVLYVALVVMLRLAGKREIGQLAPLDLLAMLLLSETVSPALTGQDTSLAASLTAAGTLLVLTAVMGRLAYHSRRAERWIEGAPVVLVEHARLVEAAARSERVTRQELESALRRHGIDELSAVRRAVVEPNGEITVLRDSRGTGG
jgi:uncharacterized membrane protein YcaP (DUF421 family)